MKNILFIITFFLCTHTILAMGYSDWSYVTAYGTQLYDPGDAVYLSINQANMDLRDLTKWYFYKNHIIGEYRPDINDDLETTYFILNELNGDLKTYNDSSLFENDLRRLELVPVFWTRWYNDHIQTIDLIYILCFFCFPIIICIILFIAVLIYASIIFKNKTLKIVCIAITLILLLPPILLILNDYFVSSI